MTARAIIVLAVLAVGGGVWLVCRLIGPHPGHRAAPRGFTEADERLADTLERVIPRPVTEHAPPWEDAPAAVIEPAAVTQGPPGAEPVPADVVLTAVRSGGRLTEVHVAVLPPLDLPAVPAMPGWVADILGHDTTDAAVESAYTRALALETRALTDGAS
jgi:hypothetical protein